MKKGRTFRVIADKCNAQLDKSKKRKARSKTFETSSKDGERRAQDQSRKKSRAEHQGSSKRFRESSGSPERGSIEGQAVSKKRSKKERKTPKGQEKTAEKRKRCQTDAALELLRMRNRLDRGRSSKQKLRLMEKLDRRLQKAADSHTSTAP